MAVCSWFSFCYIAIGALAINCGKTESFVGRHLTDDTVTWAPTDHQDRRRRYYAGQRAVRVGCAQSD